MKKEVSDMIIRLLESSKISFIGSVDDCGFPAIKAMLAPRAREGYKTIYYSTNTSSLRVAQFRQNPKASVYFCDPEYFWGVMFKGEMEVIEDQRMKDMLWENGDERYYPQGKTDPDYCVLKFTSTSGRFYNGECTQTFEVE